MNIFFLIFDLASWKYTFLFLCIITYSFYGKLHDDTPFLCTLNWFSRYFIVIIFYTTNI
jgi:hypothetical protein